MHESWKTWVHFGLLMAFSERRDSWQMPQLSSRAEGITLRLSLFVLTLGGVWIQLSTCCGPCDGCLTGVGLCRGSTSLS